MNDDQDEEDKKTEARDAKLAALIAKAQETLERTAHFGEYAAMFKSRFEAEQAAKAKKEKETMLKQKKMEAKIMAEYWKLRSKYILDVPPLMESPKEKPSWNISRKLVSDAPSPVVNGRLYAAQTRKIFLSKPQSLVPKTGQSYGHASKVFQKLLKSADNGQRRSPSPALRSHMQRPNENSTKKVTPRYGPKPLTNPKINSWAGNEIITTSDAGSSDDMISQKPERPDHRSFVAQDPKTKLPKNALEWERAQLIDKLRHGSALKLLSEAQPVHQPPQPRTISKFKSMEEEPMHFSPIKPKSKRFPAKPSARALAATKTRDVDLNWGNTLAEIEALTTRAAHVVSDRSSVPTIESNANSTRPNSSPSGISSAASTYYTDTATQPIREKPQTVAQETSAAVGISPELVSTMYDIYSNLKDMTHELNHPSQHVINYEQNLDKEAAKRKAKLKALRKKNLDGYHPGVQPKTSDTYYYGYPYYTKNGSVVGSQTSMQSHVYPGSKNQFNMTVQHETPLASIPVRME